LPWKVAKGLAVMAYSRKRVAVIDCSSKPRRMPREGSSMASPRLSKRVTVPSVWRLASCWKAKRALGSISKSLLLPPRRQTISPVFLSTL
jgi:hypothetical protein